MGRMMRPAHHRLPAHLPFDRSVEEVILARKMISPQHDGSFNSNYLPTGDPSPHQQSMLASPTSPAGCVSNLPLESYVREVSSRLGKRPRSTVVRRATPNPRRRRGWGSTPQQLRPLTGVSPPSTAQSSFGLEDIVAESIRPTVRQGCWCEQAAFQMFLPPRASFLSYSYTVCLHVCAISSAT